MQLTGDSVEAITTNSQSDRLMFAILTWNGGVEIWTDGDIVPSGMPGIGPTLQPQPSLDELEAENWQDTP